MRKITPDLEGRLTIGVLGGSFNPAHRGHLEVTAAARHLLCLDRCWWLVSPGNPLKDPAQYAPLDQRVKAARAMTRTLPWLSVSGIEADLGTRYTADTLAALKSRFPAARLVWIMGADSLLSFHRWRDWRQIAQMVPIAVVSRPGFMLPSLVSRAARALGQYRLAEDEAALLPDLEPPAWVFLPAVHNPVSSTAIRAGKGTP